MFFYFFNRDVLPEGEALGLDTEIPSTSKSDDEEDYIKEEVKGKKVSTGDEDADIIMEYGLEDYDNEGIHFIIFFTNN